jgi:hypothetical protein
MTHYEFQQAISKLNVSNSKSSEKLSMVLVYLETLDYTEIESISLEWVVLTDAVCPRLLINWR